MSNRNVLFGIIFILLFSCQEEDSCPDLFIIKADSVPIYVDEAIKYKNVETLKFVNEFDETLIFDKYFEEINEIKLELVEPVTCEFDESENVMIYYERIWNRMYYASNESDTLQFEFYPIVGNFINFDLSYYREYNLEKSNVIAPPFFYHKVVLINGEVEFNDRRFVNMESDGFDKYLDDAYQVNDKSFDDVYYWARDDSTSFYFTYEHGLVGFKDLDQIYWIREL